MPPDSDGVYQIRDAGLTFAPSSSTMDQATPLAIAGTRHPSGALTVAVTGDLDFSTAPAFQRQVHALLEGHQGDCLELDFARLNFCDLAGWRAVHAVAETAGRMRHGTRITAAAPCLDAVLHLCHISEFLGYTPPPRAF